MCGISAISGPGLSHDRTQKVRKMTALLAHRGPDGEGVYEGQQIALGHRRLAIIDLSEQGHQPMSDYSNRFIIVFNGEIYNFNELKNELKEYPFRSQCDTEVLLAAYAKWGPDFLLKMNGMFALAIWDESEKSLFVARDRMGIKPVYYTFDQDEIAICSEIRPLIKALPRKFRLNQDALSDYLQCQAVHPPQTMIQGIFQLAPGECGLWKEGHFKKRFYWRASEGVKKHGIIDNKAEAETGVLEHLKRAIEYRLVGDVPVGTFLSGGIDSSAVVALQAELSGTSVNTFSLNFNEKEFDESFYSELIAKKYKTNHHPFILKPNDFLDLLPDALSAQDHPSGDGLNSYVVSELTHREGIKVALSGLGGDEIFAGYDMFTRIHSLQKNTLLWTMPQWLKNLGSQGLFMFGRSRKAHKIASLLNVPSSSLQDIYPVFRRSFEPHQLVSLLNESHNLNHPGSRYVSKFLADLVQLPLLSRVSFSELNTYTSAVLLGDTDQMSMAHALEVRVPFLDHQLVEYVSCISDEIKFPHSPKKLLVDALGMRLPVEIVDRKKMGFTLPWEVWLKKDLFEFCRAKLEIVKSLSAFNERSVESLWSKFLKGDGGVLWMQIWLLVVLGNFLEQNELTEND